MAMQELLVVVDLMEEVVEEVVDALVLPLQ
jgi:hypothetical protein